MNIAISTRRDLNRTRRNRNRNRDKSRGPKGTKEFLERSIKFSAPRGGGRYRAIALVTDAQKREYNVINAFTVDEFIKFSAFSRIDQLRSTRM